jgi:hypothetical protein
LAAMTLTDLDALTRTLDRSVTVRGDGIPRE